MIVRVDGRHERPDRELRTGAEARALGHDGRHPDEVEVVDAGVAQRVIEGGERRQAFGASPREVKEAGYV